MNWVNERVNVAEDDRMLSEALWVSLNLFKLSIFDISSGITSSIADIFICIFTIKERILDELTIFISDELSTLDSLICSLSITNQIQDIDDMVVAMFDSVGILVNKSAYFSAFGMISLT